MFTPDKFLIKYNLNSAMITFVPALLKEIFKKGRHFKTILTKRSD